MKRLFGAYDIREHVRKNGGSFDSRSKAWEMSDEDYESLLEDVQQSGRRSNKRDRALYVDFQKVKVEEG